MEQFIGTDQEVETAEIDISIDREDHQAEMIIEEDQIQGQEIETSNIQHQRRVDLVRLLRAFLKQLHLNRIKENNA